MVQGSTMWMLLQAWSCQSTADLAEAPWQAPWKDGGSACESNTPLPVKDDRRF
jgi:hypothetical protein